MEHPTTNTLFGCCESSTPRRQAWRHWNSTVVPMPISEYVEFYWSLGRVPPRNAWRRDVKYVSRDADGRSACCDLCGTGWMATRRQMGAHMNGHKHKMQHNRLCEQVEQKREEVETLKFGRRFQSTLSLRELVNRELSLKFHQAIINDKLLSYVGCGMPGLEEVRHQVNAFKRVEIAVALDLALFKASLRPEFTSTEELRAYSVLAPGFDALAWGRLRRATNGSGSVIRLVLDRLLSWDPALVDNRRTQAHVG